METMTAGTVVAVDNRVRRERSVPIEVVEGGDLQARYDYLLKLSLRMGSWLTGPQAQLLPKGVWEEQFARYQRQLEELHGLGEQLRPVTLRGRDEPLTGDALAQEVLELFAA